MGRNPRPQVLDRYKTCSIRLRAPASWSAAAGLDGRRPVPRDAHRKCGSCATIYLASRGGVLVGFERSAYVTDLRACRWTPSAELKAGRPR